MKHARDADGHDAFMDALACGDPYEVEAPHIPLFRSTSLAALAAANVAHLPARPRSAVLLPAESVHVPASAPDPRRSRGVDTTSQTEVPVAAGSRDRN